MVPSGPQAQVARLEQEEQNPARRKAKERILKTNRRDFLEVMGASAVGIGLAFSLPAVAAQADNAATTGPKRRKMVVRADDIGQSKVCNIGTFEAIEHGVVTTAAVMLESPGTEDALERLKAYPWLAIDWHMHMWGAPVTERSKVASLVEKGGPFDGRFRGDLQQAQDVNFDEAVTELRAQLLRCDRILGKVPDTGSAGDDKTAWGRAVRQVTDEFGLVYNFSGQAATPEFFSKYIKDAQDRGEAWSKYWPSTPSPALDPDPKWADRKITTLSGLAAFKDLLTDSISSVEKNYDPVLYYTEDRFGILKTPMDVITWQAWHPGYVDYYVYRTGERTNRARAQEFVVGRAQDVAAMIDPRLKNWIKENKIELVSFRDALYGSNEYQNHLKAIGSDLRMI
jgi:predicted glycoside hydrolase/deacetylase ChbG (UPF0249 family)